MISPFLHLLLLFLLASCPSNGLGLQKVDATLQQQQGITEEIRARYPGDDGHFKFKKDITAPNISAMPLRYGNILPSRRTGRCSPIPNGFEFKVGRCQPVSSTHPAAIPKTGLLSHYLRTPERVKDMRGTHYEPKKFKADKTSLLSTSSSFRQDTTISRTTTNGEVIHHIISTRSIRGAKSLWLTIAIRNTSNYSQIAPTC
ncbi:hypothetical protein GGR55DRAFT_192984 [Xylaria sp. FL0064]|nr:hypothetical protein GGR55DRAFT_192984 [Xylaria sp. FL0064]